jgi:hypothetical protein
MKCSVKILYTNLVFICHIFLRAKKRAGVLKTDVSSDVLPVLLQLKSELSEASVSYREEMVTVQDELEDLDMKLTNLEGMHDNVFSILSTKII